MRDPRTRSGWSVAKVWCIPLMKIKQRALARCGPPAIIRQIKLLTAQQKITAECGLQDIVPRWGPPLREAPAACCGVAPARRCRAGRGAPA